jgi:D-lyxose ketol-isomerase
MGRIGQVREETSTMKRSEVNRLQREALAFYARHNFHLPVWATWQPVDFQRAGAAAAEIKSRRLGWDVVDYGSGDFARLGSVLFTIRNGPPGGAGEPYCEKVIILRDGQSLPIHFHSRKTEDIINRSGGELIAKVWPTDRRDGLGEGPVKVLADGALWREVQAGEDLVLLPGASLTVVPRVYHRFTGRGDVLIGEVSSVNDDVGDNRFLTPNPRFLTVEEDEEILYYLCNEYPA